MTRSTRRTKRVGGTTGLVGLFWGHSIRTVCGGADGRPWRSGGRRIRQDQPTSYSMMMTNFLLGLRCNPLTLTQSWSRLMIGRYKKKKVTISRSTAGWPSTYSACSPLTTGAQAGPLYVRQRLRARFRAAQNSRGTEMTYMPESLLCVQRDAVPQSVR